MHPEPRSEPMSDATRRWWDYDRPAEFEVVGEVVEVAVRDGVRLHCDLRRPARAGIPVEGRFPGVVVGFTPYLVLRDFFVGEADFFASRGYAALVPLLRGVPPSGGEWGHGSFGEAGRDARDLIEWLAAQAWCTGDVGMYGESYGGQTAYGAARERPPALRAIAPCQAPSSLYLDVIYPGGVKTAERGEIDNWPDIANLTTGGAVDADEEFAINRAHPAFDDFWRDRAFVDGLDGLDGIDGLDAIEVPVLAVGGWEDCYFRSGTLANVVAAPDRTWAVYGPWIHFFPIELTGSEVWSTGSGDREAVLAAAPPLGPGILLAWFDRWVMGLADVPVPDAPTFTSHECPPGVGAGWRELGRWAPPAGAVSHLRADGSLGRDPGAGPGAGPDGDPSGVVSFAVATDPDAPVEAVTFVSALLRTDQVLLGEPRLEVTVTLDAPEAHLLVEVLDVTVDGTETVVTEGFLAASHRDSHTAPSPAPVGQPIALTIGVRAHHYRFVAGHRVGLRLSGGRPTRITRPPAPVTVTVAPGASARLTLPGFSALS